MRTPDVTKTTAVPIHAPARPNLLAAGTSAHVVFLLLSGLFSWFALPFPGSDPWLWAGWSISLLFGCALLTIKRYQPRIDDREVDIILAVTSLLGSLWVVQQWRTDANLGAATAAWLLTLTSCILLLSGTRVFGWIWLAAIPAIASLISPSFLVAAGVLSLAGFGFTMLRNGPAPADQLGRIPARRLIQVAVALGIVAAMARIGAGS